MNYNIEKNIVIKANAIKIARELNTENGKYDDKYSSTSNYATWYQIAQNTYYASRHSAWKIFVSLFVVHVGNHETAWYGNPLNITGS